MKRSREEFQGKSAVVTALSGIFSSENSDPRTVMILPAYGKNGGILSETGKTKGALSTKTGKKRTQNGSEIRSDYIQIYGKSCIAEKTIKKEKIL